MEHRRNDMRPRTANIRQILARKESAARTVNFPELRNSGLLARALVLYVGLNVAYAVATTELLRDLPINFILALARSLPVATAVGLVWLLAIEFLRKLAYWQASVLLCGVAGLAAWLTANYLGQATWKTLTLAVTGVAAVLAYFHTLGRALSPAVTEARLQALQARIRPHFLFNAINGVLGVLRHEPKRAENALEDLAELFRALMKDNKEMRSLHDEIVLTRQYLDLEKLRLGNRLSVKWHIDEMPGEAMVPALILQPIAENAVYHGIEPSNQPGLIEISAIRKRGEVIVTVRNPFVEHAGNHHGGNKMAMGNIRERLALHFDAEARMVAGPRDGRWQVQIVLPYVGSGEAKSAL